MTAKKLTKESSVKAEKQASPRRGRPRKTPEISATKKKIPVREIKTAKEKASSKPEVKASESKRNSLAVRRHAAHEVKHPVHKPQPHKHAEAKAHAEAKSAKSEAKVQKYDLDEKIDFKHLNGKPNQIYRKIAFSFLVLTSLLLIAVIYLYYVKVDIAIVLNKQEVKGSTVIDIANDSLTATGTAAIPGLVKEIEITQTKDFESTGQQILGTSVTGKVKLINNYNRTQPLVANTRLLAANGNVVHLKETVSIPAGSSADVDVFSTDATSSIDIAAGVKLTIPGLWRGIQDKIYAESITPIKYQETVKKIIKEEDIAAAKTAIAQDIRDKANNEVVPAYKNQYSQVLFQLATDTLVAKTDAKAGEDKGKFSLNASAKVIVVAFNDDTAKKQAEDQLLSQLPANKSLVEFEKNNVTFELGNVDPVLGTASVNVTYGGTVMSKEQNIVEKQKIIGLTAPQLENFLKNLKDDNNAPMVDSYEIKFTPAFIGRVPSLLDRINIRVIPKN